MNPVLATILAILAMSGIMIILSLPNAITNMIPVFSFIFLAFLCYVNLFILWNLSIGIAWKIVMTIILIGLVFNGIEAQAFVLPLIFIQTCLFPAQVETYLAAAEPKAFSIAPQFILTQMNRLYNWASIIGRGNHTAIVIFTLFILIALVVTTLGELIMNE
ncbi:MAG: hypothetical protein LUI87_03750 [Lachnospiraceae bacterium]|nr:hypothetical protein [Lachnospiraceae bacterium]